MSNYNLSFNEIVDLFKKAYVKRKKIIENYQAYRLFNSTIDGINDLFIDIYDKYAAISWYFEPTNELKENVISALEKLFNFQGIYELLRYKSESSPQNYQLIYGNLAPEFFLVNEENLKFLCSFNHGQNVGLFIDNRLNRNLIKNLSNNKKVLNLFSYTATLSVCALYANAKDVISVDVSSSYNNWAKENLKLNGFRDYSSKVLKFDVIDYLNYAFKKKIFFDLIILDPPSFARKVGNKPFSTIRDYHKILELAIKVVEPNGIIVNICNTVKFSHDDFYEMIKNTLYNIATNSNIKFKIDNKSKMPFDFIPNGNDNIKISNQFNYLKTYLVNFYY